MIAAAALDEPRVKPVLKWAGGKSRLLPELQKRLPAEIERLQYFEPFFGGGALFFALRPARAVIGDRNERLITTMMAIRDHLPQLLVELEALESAHSLETFRATRPLLANKDLPLPARAAAFIYLNKTCFNGLYRVNKKGEFNVPFGKYANPKIRNVEALEAARDALLAARLRACSYDALVQGAGKGDFVYFDPPYMPASETASFTSYTEDGFDEGAQETLAGHFRAAAKRGAYVMMSQGNHKLIRALYKGFVISRVTNSRSIAAAGDSRARVSELIIRNYQ